jgi:formyltetrahydrofolate synthetase
MGVPADMTTALAPIPRGQGRFVLCAGLCRAGHRVPDGAVLAFRAPCDNP